MSKNLPTNLKGALAFFTAPDPRLIQEYSALLCRLEASVVHADALVAQRVRRATFAYADYAELFSLQRTSFQHMDRQNSPPTPLWLRSAEGNLLACCAFSCHNTEGTLCISDIISPKYLLPALATKMPLWQLSTLVLEPYTIHDEWPKQFALRGVHFCIETLPNHVLMHLTYENDTTNAYPFGADYYEADLPPSITADIPFYLAQAKQHNAKSVLEVACGSGRVSLALLEAGYRVTAFDHSLPMLGIFERKLRMLPAIVRRRAKLHQADMQHFAFAEQFDLVLVPFRSLQMLTATGDIEKCLACIKDHLAPNGRLIFQVTNPLNMREEDFLVPETIVYEEQDPVDRSSVTKKTWLIAYDNNAHTITQGLAYEICDSQGYITRTEERLHYALYSPEQIRLLLDNAGLAIEAHWGGFAQEPLTMGEDQIVIAKAKD